MAARIGPFLFSSVISLRRSSLPTRTTVRAISTLAVQGLFHLLFAFRTDSHFQFPLTCAKAHGVGEATLTRARSRSILTFEMDLAAGFVRFDIRVRGPKPVTGLEAWKRDVGRPLTVGNPDQRAHLLAALGHPRLRIFRVVRDDDGDETLRALGFTPYRLEVDHSGANVLPT